MKSQSCSAQVVKVWSQGRLWKTVCADCLSKPFVGKCSLMMVHCLGCMVNTHADDLCHAMRNVTMADKLLMFTVLSPDENM